MSLQLGRRELKAIYSHCIFSEGCVDAVDAKAFIDMWNSAIETLSLVHKVYVRTPPNMKFVNGLWLASVRFSFGPKK